jgi:hypothetical protein
MLYPPRTISPPACFPGTSLQRHQRSDKADYAIHVQLDKTPRYNLPSLSGHSCRPRSRKTHLTKISAWRQPTPTSKTITSPPVQASQSCLPTTSPHQPPVIPAERVPSQNRRSRMGHTLARPCRERWQTESPHYSLSRIQCRCCHSLTFSLLEGDTPVTSKTRSPTG